MDPLFGLGCELPADFQPWSAPTYTAHTILLVDCSGSMRTADVALEAGEAPIARSEAVRRILLETFLRRQLLSGAQVSERVSLIKIQPETAGETPLPFALFPLEETLSERITTAVSEPRSHGPYLPALRLLAKLIGFAEPHMMAHAKTSVLFLTDGRPSDQVDERELPAQLRAELAQFTSVEQFQLLGFGEADESVLLMMADAVPGRVATCERVSSGRGGFSSLEQSVSTFSSSVTVSRISSVSAVDHHKPLRRINRSFTERLDSYPECAIDLPPRKVGDFVGELQPLRGLHDVLISSFLLGHGGERNAYLMRFASDNKFTRRDEKWVVKESRHERSDGEEYEFHKKALVTQRAAEELANRFNDEASELGLAGLPKVAYMTCCFLTTGKMAKSDGQPEDPHEPESRSLFAERMIEGQFR